MDKPVAAPLRASLLDRLLDDEEDEAEPDQEQQEGNGVTDAIEYIQQPKQSVSQVFLHRAAPVFHGEEAQAS
jgi:hypothetical protein